MKIQFQFLIIFFLTFGILKDANAIFRTRILNTDASMYFGLTNTYSGSCSASFDPSSNKVNSLGQFYNVDSCYTSIELATWVDVVGLSQQLTANIDTVKNLETSLKTQKTDITSQIETDHKALSQQIEKVIQELVANPHLIGNNSQTNGNRQALEALITAIVKKELKEAVKLNCQNTIGE